MHRILLGLALVLAAWTQTARADYWARWDRVGGGWTTNWVGPVAGNANVCIHAHSGSRCGTYNYCGNYRNGAVTYWWPYGCGGQLWRIRCTVRPAASSVNTDCQNYASTAARQANENLRRRCGYTGNRWTTSYQGHYGWCLRAHPSARASENQARLAGLAQCAGGVRGDVLGTYWSEYELGWTGTWRRRGRSNVFDAEWVHPQHGRERAVLTMYVSGAAVTIVRQQVGPSYPGRRCTYRGTISGRVVGGTYGCDWSPGPHGFRATIY